MARTPEEIIQELERNLFPYVFDHPGNEKIISMAILKEETGKIERCEYGVVAQKKLHGFSMRCSIVDEDSIKSLVDEGRTITCEESRKFFEGVNNKNAKLFLEVCDLIKPAMQEIQNLEKGGWSKDK